MNSIERAKLINKAAGLGLKYEKQYRGCAQCTLAAVMDTLDISDPMIFRAGSGLASGGGLLCTGACGGYTGGTMIMSALFGRRRENFDNDRDYKYTSFRITRDLNDKFIEEYNTAVCGEIHEKIFGRTYNLLSDQDKTDFEKDGAHDDKCTEVVSKAAAWTVEVILNEMEKRDLELKDLKMLMAGG
ncbi:MAG: C_GCAxxG_C_C family protein [Spirochaetales bacterium]|nr:C_GCAxxG_C_C family protein [Spirochaetales bacterium]